MCGISLVVQKQQQQQAQQQQCLDEPHEACNDQTTRNSQPLHEDTCKFQRRLLSRRGPDQYGEQQAHVTSSNGTKLQLSFAASLLQLRGHTPPAVPLCDAASGDVLCFNGEIYGGLHVPPGQNDGQVLLQALCTTADVAHVLSQLRGPWSILYWRPATGTLWFGRDVLGRRSLLVHFPQRDNPNEQLLLTSVAPHLATNSTTTNGSQAHSSHAASGMVHPLAAGGLAEAPSNRSRSPCDPQPASPDLMDPLASQIAACTLVPAELDAMRTSARALQAQATIEEGEDEDMGQDPSAYWQELPPGIYSIQLGSPQGQQQPSGLSQPTGLQSGLMHGADNGAQPCGGVATKDAHDPQSPVLPCDTESCYQGPSETPVLCWGAVMQRHAWCDPLISRVHAYLRPENQHVSAAAGVRTSSLGMTATAAVAVPYASGEVVSASSSTSLPSMLCLGGAGTAQGTDTAPTAQGTDTAPTAQGTDTAPTAQGTDTAQGTASCSVPCSLRGPAWDFDSAVEALLLAMKAAVDVQCQSFDTLSTSAAHAAAAPEPGSPPGSSTSTSTRMCEPPVMILFSGGVDSVLLAALAHCSLPPGCSIDLCNVCFDCGRSPDRVAARSALQELSGWAPGRNWRLVEVDATLQDTDQHKAHLLALLHPAGTVMDLNIGAALWLAASGTGVLRLPPRTSPTAARDASAGFSSAGDASAGFTSAGHASAGSISAGDAPAASSSAGNASTESISGTEGTGSLPSFLPTADNVAEGSMYCSRARIVLLGHGADEQCAGYGRHRTRFRTGGAAALSAELSLDMRRMWLRNCGRDDRLVSDRGREARHPFLDEGVMDLLLGLPLHCIADLRQAPGLGDKKILRQALVRLGLPEAAGRVKRAIQFGSRIGKLSNRREFGSNRAANKLNAGSLALSKLPAANGTSRE